MPELSPYDTPYKSQLASYSSLIKSYESNVEYLLRKCNALSQFIVESASHTQNGLMVNDSQSIKVITILSLVYLPASFIAVSTQVSAVLMNNPADLQADIFRDAILRITDSSKIMGILSFSCFSHIIYSRRMVVVDVTIEELKELSNEKGSREEFLIVGI